MGPWRTEMCPKLSRSAIISETMHQIEILKASYALQLSILSTGTHFQRVSEHYMVTRKFLSILTFERGLASASAQYKSMEYGRTQGFVPVHLVKGIYYSWARDNWPPHTPPKMAKKFNTPTFLGRANADTGWLFPWGNGWFAYCTRGSVFLATVQLTCTHVGGFIVVEVKLQRGSLSHALCIVCQRMLIVCRMFQLTSTLKPFLQLVVSL